MDKVSIIVPIYRTEDVIITTLESIVNQSYVNIEVILVNDGSPDKSAELAADYLSRTKIPWELINIPNGGVSNARNVGIKNSTAKWIVCIDSDDYVHADYLRRMMDAISMTNADFAFCQYKLVSRENIGEGLTFDEGIRTYSSEELKLIYLHRALQMILPGMLIKRSIFDEVLFDVNCPYSEDTLFTWELIFRTRLGVCVRADMYNYYMREGSKQHSLTIEACEKSIICYSGMIERLLQQYPNESTFIEAILPKFHLSAYHVLSRCVSWKSFKMSYDNVMQLRLRELWKYADCKLRVYSLLYSFFPRIFYYLSRKI